MNAETLARAMYETLVGPITNEVWQRVAGATPWMIRYAEKAISRYEEIAKVQSPKCSTCDGRRFVCDAFGMVGPCSDHPEQEHPNRRPCPACRTENA